MSAWQTMSLQGLGEAKNHQNGAVLVRLKHVQGSAPRESGTQMLVTENRQYGTIGGGALEYQATARARQLIGNGPDHLEETAILGPDLGQCCGGQVDLVFERLNGSAAEIRERLIAASAPPLTLYLFGAGHVGKALVHVLKDLPFAVHWIDARPQSFAHDIDPAVQVVRAADPALMVKGAPKNTIFLVMTHDHDLDYAIIRNVLLRDDFHFAGLIGSKTKRARFVQRLAREGVNETALARLTCPIGLLGIPGKAPEAIAIAVAAQLLTLCL